MAYERSRKFVPIRLDNKWAHINLGMGCNNGCGYCIQEKDVDYDNSGIHNDFSVKSLLKQLEEHPFVSKRQPLVIGNATDPFLKKNLDDVKALLKGLESQNYKSSVSIITKLYPKDRGILGNKTLNMLSRFINIKPVLLVSYVGYKNRKLEPPSGKDRVKLIRQAHDRGIPTILYYRPLSATWMDDGEPVLEKIERVATETKGNIDALVYGGLYYTEEIQANIKKRGLPEPFKNPLVGKNYDSRTIRRDLKKIFRRVNPGLGMFQSTSCGVSYVQGQQNFLGYYGLRSLESKSKECGHPCIPEQRDLCAKKTKKVSSWSIRKVLKELGLKGTKFENHAKFVRIYTKLNPTQYNYARQNLSKFTLDDRIIEYNKKNNTLLYRNSISP